MSFPRSLVLCLALATSVTSFHNFAGVGRDRSRVMTKALTASKEVNKVTLLAGDGIGPEITAATVAVLEALGKARGFKFEFTNALIGGAALDAVDDPFPAETLSSCQASDSVLLACIGG